MMLRGGKRALTSIVSTYMLDVKEKWVNFLKNYGVGRIIGGFDLPLSIFVKNYHG